MAGSSSHWNWRLRAGHAATPGRPAPWSAPPSSAGRRRLVLIRTSSPASLRAGFATQSYIIGKADRQIMRHGRWSSSKHLERYIREVDLFQGNNPTDGLL